MKRLNAAITESFREKANEASKEESIRITAEPLPTDTLIQLINKDGEKSFNFVKSGDNDAEETFFDSSENKISSNVEPIIITSTSISISLEENVVPFVTTTTAKPKQIDSKYSPSTTSTVAPSSTLKPKITKGKLE